MYIRVEVVARHFLGNASALILASGMADILDHRDRCTGFCTQLCAQDGLIKAQRKRVGGNCTGLGCTAALAVGTGNDHAVRALYSIHCGCHVGGPQFTVHIAAAVAVAVIDHETAAHGVLNRDCHGTYFSQTLAVAVNLHGRAAAIFTIHDDRQRGRIADTLGRPDVLFPVGKARRDAIHGKFQFAAADQAGIMADQFRNTGGNAVINTGRPDKFASLQQ